MLKWWWWAEELCVARRRCRRWCSPALKSKPLPGCSSWQKRLSSQRGIPPEKAPCRHWWQTQWVRHKMAQLLPKSVWPFSPWVVLQRQNLLFCKTVKINTNIRSFVHEGNIIILTGKLITYYVCLYFGIRNGNICHFKWSYNFYIWKENPLFGLGNLILLIKLLVSWLPSHFLSKWEQNPTITITTFNLQYSFLTYVIIYIVQNLLHHDKPLDLNPLVFKGPPT